jgi:hypothetical protein
MRLKSLVSVPVLLVALLCFVAIQPCHGQDDDQTVRVFIFAGQSNMVGSDSKVADVDNFPPFRGLGDSQNEVKFSFCLGRENKTKSEGWETLKPVNNIVGPELSFARAITSEIESPIAIVKIAAGETHLGGDWNPDEPIGFKMYPLALQFVKDSLAELEKQGLKYRLEGFMWHQGENDMFNEDYQKNYGANLENFLACWRRDLKTPKLKFYLGELCTKTIWGMDLRPRMYAISLGQKSVAESDPLAEYIPTSHVGVEIGGGVGLHYHYGTLGQLEHGVNYANAYLNTIGITSTKTDELKDWPYADGERINLYVVAGHRNMEGERAFVQDLADDESNRHLLQANMNVAFKYSIGGGVQSSPYWIPLKPDGYYDTFGPEVSFGDTLSKNSDEPFAIAKFTHSGSQMIDWTPEGSVAKSRNLYPAFLDFIQQSVAELEAKGHMVDLAGIIYHVGENDMSFTPFRKRSAEHLNTLVRQLRTDLDLPELEWIVSQQSPTDDERVNAVDVVADFEKLAAEDEHLRLIQVFDLPGREKKLVISTPGIVELGRRLAKAVTVKD